MCREVVGRQLWAAAAGTSGRILDAVSEQKLVSKLRLFFGHCFIGGLIIWSEISDQIWSEKTRPKINPQSIFFPSGCRAFPRARLRLRPAQSTATRTNGTSGDQSLETKIVLIFGRWFQGRFHNRAMHATKLPEYGVFQRVGPESCKLQDLGLRLAGLESESEGESGLQVLQITGLGSPRLVRLVEF